MGKNKIYVFFSSRFLSRILVLCSPALLEFNLIDLMMKKMAEEKEKRDAMRQSREDDNIDIDPCNSSTPPKIFPTLTLKNYRCALKNYPSFPSRIDI